MAKHPIEVMTSGERRRRWSREDKERLVAACFEPDAVISKIARAAGIHVSQLFRWRKELCRIEEPRSDTATLVAGDRMRGRFDSLSRSTGIAHHIPSSSEA